MNKKRTIGLLGGSFNPAHAGHLHISLEAMRRLGLDEIWWLVSPQNPLKSTEGMAGFNERYASARAMARHPRIKVSDFEARNHTQYTADTIEKLTTYHPNIHFVWLMGSDNLIHFHKWQEWRKISELAAIAVYDRAPDVYRASKSRTFFSLRHAITTPSKLTSEPLPALALLHEKRHSMSATMLRKTLGENAFMGHNKDAVNAKGGKYYSHYRIKRL